MKTTRLDVSAFHGSTYAEKLRAAIASMSDDQIWVLDCSAMIGHCQESVDIPSNAILTGFAGFLLAPTKEWIEYAQRETARAAAVMECDKYGDRAYVVCDLGGYEEAFPNCEILMALAVGEYQGDYVVLLERKGKCGEKFGFVVIAYGSCTGCDALLAAKAGRGNVDEELESVANSVHWEPSKAALLAYIQAKDKEIINTYMTESQRKKVWETVTKTLETMEKK